MKTYTPQAGSVPARCAEELSLIAELSSAALADAVGVKPNDLHAYLQSAIKWGLIVRTRRDGITWYSLGDDSMPGTSDRVPPKQETTAAADTSERMLPRCANCMAAGMRTCHCPGFGEAYDAKTETFKPVEPVAAATAKIAVPFAPHWLDKSFPRVGHVAPVPATPKRGEAYLSRADKHIDDRTFSVGLFTDGRLVLEIGGELVTLIQSETETLCAYLDRMAA